MKLGFFTMPVHPKGRTYSETLAEDREAFIMADRLGFAEGYCGEHLTDECENIPNSMMFLASLMGVTSRIRLGTAVVNLPHSHPVVIASNAAMLDNMLQGRFLMGIGAGILRTDAEALELLDKNRGAMFVEAIDQVLAIWKGEAPYNIAGQFWNVSTAKTIWPEVGLGAIVKPYQTPHPPILGMATDPNSQGLVAIGKRGWWPVSSGFLYAGWLKNHWQNYARGCAEAGHAAERKNWRVARTIFVADDDRTAARYGKDDPQSPYRHYMHQLSSKLRASRKLDSFKPDPSMSDEAVTLDFILDNIAIVGSVNRVVDQILAIAEETGGFGTLLYAGIDWADPKLGKRSMELMAEKVMPAVNSALGTAHAAE